MFRIKTEDFFRTCGFFSCSLTSLPALRCFLMSFWCCSPVLLSRTSQQRCAEPGRRLLEGSGELLVARGKSKKSKKSKKRSPGVRVWAHGVWDHRQLDTKQGHRARDDLKVEQNHRVTE